MNDNITYDERDTPLGRYLQQARADRGLSVRGLAATAGVDFSWLSKVERGVIDAPDARQLWKLARVLDVEPADLSVAVGYTDHAALPALTPYLRAKYELPESAVDELARFFDEVTSRYDKKGGPDARDHHSTT